MLESLFVALFAAAAGQLDPGAPAEAAPTESAALAPAQSSPDIAVVAPEQAADPMVCEFQTRTGSITRRRVCRPASEVEREEANSEFRQRNMRRWGTIREGRLGF